MACMKADKRKSNYSIETNAYSNKIIIDWYFVDKSGKTEAEWEKVLTRNILHP
jgi:hypothetical protein